MQMPQSYNILNQSVAYWGRLNSHHCQLSLCPSYDFMSSGAQSYKKGAGYLTHWSLSRLS